MKKFIIISMLLFSVSIMFAQEIPEDNSSTKKLSNFEKVELFLNKGSFIKYSYALEDYGLFRKELYYYPKSNIHSFNFESYSKDSNTEDFQFVTNMPRTDVEISSYKYYISLDEDYNLIIIDKSLID